MWFEGEVMDGEVKMGLHKSQQNTYICGFTHTNLLVFHLNLGQENHIEARFLFTEIQCTTGPKKSIQ